MALFAGLGTLASAQLPPEISTLVDLNLLNPDGSNIDTSLLLTIDYFDSNLNPQSLNSVDNMNIIEWSIYNGKSNVYSEVSAKGGTDITITVDGYEPITVTAVSGGYVTGDYYLVPVDNSPGNGCANKNENGNRKNC
ncbi:MAG: hypothetical protein V3R93_07270 [Candidatus Hydrothermarchaeaceae archaeon]